MFIQHSFRNYIQFWCYKMMLSLYRPVIKYFADFSQLFGISTSQDNNRDEVSNASRKSEQAPERHKRYASQAEVSKNDLPASFCKRVLCKEVCNKLSLRVWTGSSGVARVGRCVCGGVQGQNADDKIGKSKINIHDIWSSNGYFFIAGCDLPHRKFSPLATIRTELDSLKQLTLM